MQNEGGGPEPKIPPGVENAIAFPLAIPPGERAISLQARRALFRTATGHGQTDLDASFFGALIPPSGCAHPPMDHIKGSAGECSHRHRSNDVVVLPLGDHVAPKREFGLTRSLHRSVRTFKEHQTAMQNKDARERNETPARLKAKNVSLCQIRQYRHNWQSVGSSARAMW